MSSSSGQEKHSDKGKEKEFDDADPESHPGHHPGRHHIQKHQKVLSWWFAGFLLIAEVIGVGVLALPSAFQQLGWVLAIISLLYSFAINMYAGLMLSEARATYMKLGTEVNSYMDIMHRAYGPRSSHFVAVLVYVYLVFVNANFVIIMRTSLTLIFYTSKLCNTVWLLICVAMLLPVSQFRMLAELKWLPIANFFVISISVFLQLIDLGLSRTVLPVTHSPQVNGSEIYPSNMTVATYFSAQALIVFSFSGAAIYLEILGEMRKPDSFKYSLLAVAGPMVLSLYLLTAITGYAFLGSTPFDLIIEVLPYGPLLQTACVLLICHLLIAFSVNHTVVATAIDRRINAKVSADLKSWKGRLTHLAVSVGLLVIIFVITNVISFFSQMTSLIGSLVSPIIGFMLPIVLALKTRSETKQKTSLLEMAWIVTTFIFSFLVFVLGTYASIKDIMCALLLCAARALTRLLCVLYDRQESSLSPPFSCNS